mgnify:CR=1 FL=1
MADDENLAELERDLLVLLGDPYSSHQDINGVDAFFRTLYESELRDCLRRAYKEVSPIEQQFELDRWKLSYSLQAINGRALPDNLEAKRKLIDSWLTIYVQLLVDAFDTVCTEEEDKILQLKNSTGILEQTSNEDE